MTLNLQVAGILLALSAVSMGAALDYRADKPLDYRATNESWQQVVSNDGSWRVHWRLVIDSKEVELPSPRKRFAIELRLESLRNPADTVRGVLVDAQMPEHSHGMNVAPTITLESGSLARAEGMLFHMNGRWEVDVDIDDGTTVERAQWNIGMY